MNKLILFLLALSMPLLANAMDTEENEKPFNSPLLRRIREIFPNASKENISDQELNKIYDSTSKKEIFELSLDSFLIKKEMKLKRNSK